MEDLRKIFAGRLLTDPADMAPFLIDWRRRWRGRARAVAQPDSAADVAAVVRWCFERGVPVVPQGGNTGLSGGSVPDGSGTALLLSLTRLNRVREIDAANNTVTAEAGVTLAAVQAAASSVEKLFPLSLAAEGSCTIGGTLATNAGGVHVLRYGSARALCLGLEVVTATGEVWDGLRGLRKDNSGYDLRDLYIGSEGTLGVITAAVLKLFPRPAWRHTGFAAVRSPADAMRVFALFQARLSPELTAFELISDVCVSLVLRHVATARAPLAGASPWFLLIELATDRPGAEADFLALLEQAAAADWVTDATLAGSEAQRAALWALRENISDAQAAYGPTIKHDIAVKLARIPSFVQAAETLVAARFSALRPVVFGHLGDGNLHYNFSPPEAGAAGFMEQEPALNLALHDLVAAHGGSISAEHGLGVLRAAEAARYKSPVEMSLMRTLKNALDPRGIMNPGKLLP